MFRHLINIFLWFLPPTRMFAFRRLCLRAAGLDLGAQVCFCGRGWVYGRGKVHIGHETWLSPGVTIHSHQEAQIVIGDRCDIGPGVEFIPGSHQFGPSSRRAGLGTARPIRVGSGCWIGAGSIILGGVVIGDGAVIAAGAVVTRSVSADSLVAGVPATPKRELAS